MVMQEITASCFQKMVQAGSESLAKNADYVNSLNVFPVPDGDTGTNMTMSMSAGAEAVANSDKTTIGEIANILARGLLMGARGNSGVILSQLFRGFSKAVVDKEVLSAEDLSNALRNGVETAYKAVMQPVEGTILTVSKGAARFALKKAAETSDVVEVMRAALEGAQKYLLKTPDLLPILKEVGVVDSGAQGLTYIYEGFLASLTGDFKTIDAFKTMPLAMEQMIDVEHNKTAAGHFLSEDIKFGYCTEIVLHLGEGKTVTDKFDREIFQKYLSNLGDSLLVVNDDEIVKVHIHTEIPGKVLNYGQRFGLLAKIKVDNMRLQHDAVVEKVISKIRQVNQKKVKTAVIAVSVGAGLKKLFESLGVSYVLPGGQTMNPSMEDLLKAIERVNAEEVVILPNNKNILMAAETAAKVAKIPVAIVPSKTITQGITSMLGFNPELPLDEIKIAMTKMLSVVTSAQIAIAVRDTNISGLEVHQGDYLGMIKNKIVVAKTEIIAAAFATLQKMITADTEVLMVIIGEDGNHDEVKKIVSMIEENYENLEIEVHQGDQPVYPYLFSVE